MLNNVTIKTRLVVIIGFLLSTCMLIGGGGLYALGSVNASLQTVYDDRLVALGQLDQVIRIVNRSQLSLAKAVGGDPAKIPAALESISKNTADLDKVWGEYAATYLTPEEKVLAAAFVEQRAIFDKEALNPAVAALRKQDLAAASAIVQGPMTTIYEQVRVPMNKLIALQLDVAKQEYAASQAHYSQFRSLSIGLLLLAAVLGVATGAWLIRSIMRPLDTAITLAGAIASGDLSRQIDVDSTNEMGRLLQALKDMSGALVTTVSAVRASSDTIATATSEIATGNMDLSNRTEQQAASLEETASSMEELTSTVRQNADNARSASALVTRASSDAVDGGRAVSKVIATMELIKGSSSKMSDIISVIDGIAFQTNILALNAAVEAARAGEEGRGFAVVAAEVRSLAQRSATAAKEIKTLIDDSVANVDQGGKLVIDAGATIDKVVVSVKQVSDIMAEIAAASEEQSTGIDQINQSVVQMDEVTQRNAALVEESAAAAASLQEQTEALAQAVSIFVLSGSQAAPVRVVAAAPRAPAIPLRRPAARPALTAAGGSKWSSY